MYNIVCKQNSQGKEKRLLRLEESLHKVNPKGNTVEEVAPKRSQTIVPEPAASQRDTTVKSLNLHKRKRNHTPPHSLGGGGRSQVPLEEKVEKPRIL